MPCCVCLQYLSGRSRIVIIFRCTTNAKTRLLRGPLHALQVDAFFRHFVEWRKFAQALYRLDYAISDVIDFGVGVEASDAEADGAVRQVIARAQGLQYIRWLQRRRGAGRAAGNRDVVDAHQQRLAFHVGKTDVQVAGQPMLHGAVDIDLVEPAHDAVPQAIAQYREANAFLRHFLVSQGASLAESDDAGDVQRPRTHAALMAAAVNDGRNLYPRILAADIERTHTLGSVHFVRGNRHDVNVLLDHVDGNLAHRLGGVGVEDDAALVAQLADLGPGLQHTDFVVGGHDGDQNGLVGHGVLQLVEIYEAVFLHRQVGDAVSVFLQALAGIEHRLVFGDGRDDVIPFLLVHFGDALDSQVVALSGAGSKDDFFGGGAHQPGDPFARNFDAFFRRPAKGVVAAGGVTELLHEVGQHFFQHPRIHRGGGMVVHVNGQLDAIRGAVLLLGDCFYFRAHRGSPQTYLLANPDQVRRP